MKIKMLILLGIIVLVLPSVFAENLSISLLPHYFMNGQEINYYGQNFEGISFDLIGDTTGITNLSIVDTSPNELKESITLISTHLDYVNELFGRTGIFRVNKNETYWIGIKGIDSNNNSVYGEASKFIETNSVNSDWLTQIGSSIYPDNPQNGELIFGVIVIITLFLIFKFDLLSKLKKG